MLSCRTEERKMNEKDLKEHLSRIPNWAMVPFRNEVLNLLQRELDAREIIEDILEGLHPADGDGFSTSGVLVLTDRRLLLLSGENRRLRPLSIPRGNITSVSIERGRSTVDLVLHHTEVTRFRSFTPHHRVSLFLGLLDGTVEPEAIQKKKETRASSVTIHEIEKERREHNGVTKKTDTAQRAPSTPEETLPEESLEDVMEEIDALVGMEEIKEQIQTLVNLIRIQEERKKRELPTTPFSLHAVFYGPPGTGKTTIARLLSRVYRALGLLPKGHIKETDRAGLVAGYVGQTATQTDQVVQEARGGILFIDEAYTLSPESAQRDYGQEAIDTILKRMEDLRDELVVIVAGYPDEMKRFINSNPGLKSRFSRYFYFDHYTPEELMAIFDIFSGKVKFTVTDQARLKLNKLITGYHQTRGRSFGNGRLVRNLFEKIIEEQANRLAEIPELSDEMLSTITAEDIPEREERDI